MGLGMFQKHRREREDYALATLAEAVEAAPEDEKEATQAVLDRAKVDAEASAKADAAREDTSAVGVDVPDWEPTDEARGQEPGESPDGSEPGEPGSEGTAPTAPEESGEAAQEDVKPAGNASTAEWTEYALAHGKTEEDLQGLSRDGIRDLFA